MPTTVDAEAARIQTVYAHRPKQPHYSHHDPSQIFLLHTIERHVLSIFRKLEYPFHRVRVLDVGCGGGHWLRQFVQWGVSPNAIAGVDLLESRVEFARVRCPGEMNIQVANATALPFPDARFDLVAQFIMFSSVICGTTKRDMAREMLRVTAPGGAILWCDFFVNNPTNPNVRGIGQAELRTLFPGCTMQLRRMVLAPPITRRLAKYSWSLCHLLERLQICNTFYLAWIQKT